MKTPCRFHIKTVGDLKKALETFEDSDTIDAMYEFKAKDLIDEIEAEELGPEVLLPKSFLCLEPSQRPFRHSELRFKA